jgi:purine-binding chemotaxis protein CheW
MAVPSRYIREVIRLGPLTPLPRVAPYVLGVCGHRGEILPVIDLLRFLERGSTPLGERTRLFVGTTESLTVAWVCEGTLGLRRIQANQLRPPPLGGDSGIAQLTAVVPSTGGQPVLNVLNFARLIQAARQKAVAR